MAVLVHSKWAQTSGILSESILRYLFLISGFLVIFHPGATAIFVLTVSQ